ncbi:TonB-dependent receptor [Flammeovirga yaeyamensis]|uniref:TonB-dependent receptor n=1 Tax=Flammeovirga yaeyamensis TaxID=367791 RepID=A0AAX1MZL9_9BACT|nr:TonB-dependent receptor family protein [Flammeovirga yaeyamensis]MBB3700942.1 outer membrane receptor protein involved in Fe transport [Flammeovirga yaeyamensis]NMF38049.1 TonB-dependent receptor [Flammeovirga yaeyamensis]QWG00699.1 TonB-dependent receptor [Flammeovirga yaeyamensis]
MRYLIFLTSFILIQTSAFAQRPTDAGKRGGARPKIGVVTAKVTDADSKEPLEFVTVALFSAKDSSFITGGATDQQGRVKISEVQVGKIFAKLTFIGYDETVTSSFIIKPDAPEKFLGNLVMTASAKALDEVTVTAERDMMELGIDKRTFNVAQDLTTVGGSMTDALNNIPSIDVDQDGSVSLRGSSNVTIFIDGKPSNLTSESTADILDQIPASSIERVEVITNPSAKYDPEGTSGIINIVLKKDRKGGVNGTASVTVGNNNKYNANVGVNARVGKLNVFGNYSGRYNERWQERTQTQKNYDRETNAFTGSNVQNTKRDDERLSHLFKTGLDYDFNDYNNVYVNATFNMGEGTNNEKLLVNYYDQNDDAYDLFLRDNVSTRENQTQEYNFGWHRTFVNPNQVLDVSGQISTSNRVSNGNFDEYGYDGNGGLVSSPSFQQRNRNDGPSELYIAQIDYTHPLSEKSTLEVGAKSTLRRIGADFTSESLQGGNWVSDDSLNNNFNYNEDVHAAYAMFRHEAGKFGYQLGVRAEQAYTTSILDENALTDRQEVQNNYFALYPTVHVSYKFAQQREVSFGYSRRVNRPRGRTLNPFPDYSNPQSLRKGNPYLKPEFIDALEVTYQHGWDDITLTGSVYYRYTHDAMLRVTSATPEGVTILSWDNMDNKQSYGFEGIATYNMTKWWKFTGSTNIYNLQINGNSGDLDLSNQAWTMNAKLMSSTNLTKTTTLQLSGRFSSRRATAQGHIDPMGGLDVAVSQRLFKGKGTLQARVSDVLNTYQFNVHSEGVGFTSDMTADWESRVAYLTFSYRFGQMNKGSKKKRKKSDSSGGGDDMMDMM